MNILGFNITRFPKTKSADETSLSQLSPSALAWMRGEDIDNRGAVLSNAYQQSVWVYRAINVLAEQVANVPFLFSRGERGRENLITSGPLADFYARPHPHIDQFQYWELRVIWLMLRGECMRVPIWDSSSSSFSSSSSPRRHLKSVLLLDPSRFQHVIEDGELIGWRYTGVGPNTPLESQVFLPEEVWFEKLPNPFDFWRGMPPLFTATLPAKTDFAAASFMHGLIDNNADMGVIVRTEQPLNDAQQEQIIAHLRQRKRRAGTADQPLLLWSGAEVVKPQLSSADMQFLENRKFTRSEICAAFGVPEEIVTTTDHNKYDVMSGARLNFIENRVAPLCRRLEAAEGPTVAAIDPHATGWFDTDSLPIMQEALAKRIKTASGLWQMGVSLNELNRLFDLGITPQPSGDITYAPSKFRPVLPSLPPGKSSSPALRSLGEGGSSPAPPAGERSEQGPSILIPQLTIKYPMDITSRLTPLSDGRQGLRSTIQTDVRSALAGEEALPPYTLDFTSSDATLDRYGEIISPTGWNLETYRRNPVFQNSHQYGNIIFTLGKAVLTEVRGTSLFQRIQFAVDANPMAKIAHALYAGGFLKAVSVGFIPIKWEDGTAQTPYRRKYMEQELLEVSAVAIPANPNALTMALKSGAIEKSDLQSTLEILRQAVSPAPSTSAPDLLALLRSIRNQLKHL